MSKKNPIKPSKLYKITKHAVYSIDVKLPKATKVSSNVELKQVGNQKFVPFGDDNNHPAVIRDGYIYMSPVLIASIRYKSSLMVGQGVYAAKITGYTKNGEEILEAVIDDEINQFLNNKNFNSYLGKASYNLQAYGNLFPELILNEPKTKILRISEKSTVNSRWGTNKDGKIESILLMPDWTEIDEEKMKIIPTLDVDNPLVDLEERKNKLTSFGYINSNYSFNYYNLPDFESAINSKWINLSLKTPAFLDAAYENAFSGLFHVQIPIEWIDYTFPADNWEDDQDRLDEIDKFLDEFDKDMTTPGNSKKSLTNIGVPDSEGKNIYWKVDEIKNSSNFTKEILANDAADNQLTTTFLINDAVFLRKTSSGMGAGSGSDILNAHLINISMLKNPRDAIMEPIELIRDFNGWNQNIVFRFRDTILTTLDTNSPTDTVVM